MPTLHLFTSDAPPLSIQKIESKIHKKTCFKLPRCFCIKQLSITISEGPGSFALLEECRAELWLLGNPLATELASVSFRGGCSFTLPESNKEQNGKSRPYWTDEIRITGTSHSSSRWSALIIEHPEAAGLRNEFLCNKPLYSITTEAGFGDIVQGLACKAIFTYLVGIDPASIASTIMEDATASQIRRKQGKALKEILNDIDCLDLSEEVIRGFLPPSNSGKESHSQIILKLISDYFNACVQSAEPKRCLILGGAGTFEIMCRALSEQLGVAGKHRPKRMHRLYAALDNMYLSSAIKYEVVTPKNYSDLHEYVVCHSRLGDTSRIRILDIEVIPYFLDNYPDSHDQWLMNTPAFRQNNFTPSSMHALCDRLFPGHQAVFISDGYSHARDILLKPKNLAWLASRLGKDINLIAEEIYISIATMEQALCVSASKAFKNQIVIGNGEHENRHTLDLIINCNGCISSSGHFCFSIMNFLSRRSQVLFAKTEGDRYSIRRSGLELMPLPTINQSG